MDVGVGWQGGGSLLELNGELDHVCLLIALPPNLDLSKFVTNLKTTSSRLSPRRCSGSIVSPYSGPGSVRYLERRGTALDPATGRRIPLSGEILTEGLTE